MTEIKLAWHRKTLFQETTELGIFLFKIMFLLTVTFMKTFNVLQVHVKWNKPQMGHTYIIMPTDKLRLLVWYNEYTERCTVQILLYS